MVDAREIPSRLTSVPDGPRGLWEDFLYLAWCPSALFARLPIQNRFASAMLVIMLLHVLGALAIVGTGVYDYEIEVATERQIAQARVTYEGEEGQQLESALQSLEKGAIFAKSLQRVLLVCDGPLRLTVTVTVFTAILFVFAAVASGKPNPPLLSGVVAYAWAVELARLALRVCLIARLGVSRVETSAAALLQPDPSNFLRYLLLRRLDPFDLWFWILIAMGLYHSGQMSKRAAWTSVVLLATGVIIMQLGWDVLQLAQWPQSMGDANANR